MATRFQTKIIRSRARFEIKPLSAQQMIAIAQPVRDDIEQRILRGETVYDAAAPPLKPGYARAKSRKAPPALRNWRWTGRTLRSMKVLSAQENKAVIGFTDSVANFRAYLNNRRSRQFGVSPRNQKTLIEKYREQRSGIVAKKIA